MTHKYNSILYKQEKFHAKLPIHWLNYKQNTAWDYSFGKILTADQILLNTTSHSCKQLLHSKHTLCYNHAVTHCT